MTRRTGLDIDSSYKDFLLSAAAKKESSSECDERSGDEGKVEGEEEEVVEEEVAVVAMEVQPEQEQEHQEQHHEQEQDQEQQQQQQQQQKQQETPDVAMKECSDDDDSSDDEAEEDEHEGQELAVWGEPMDRDDPLRDRLVGSVLGKQLVSVLDSLGSTEAEMLKHVAAWRCKLEAIEAEFEQAEKDHLALLAVGESSVILLTPPSPSLLKHLIKAEGGAAE